MNSSDEEDDCFCLICLGAYSNSCKEEGWVQCTSCKKWVHESVLKVIYCSTHVEIVLQIMKKIILIVMEIINIT